MRHSQLMTGSIKSKLSADLELSKASFNAENEVFWLYEQKGRPKLVRGAFGDAVDERVDRRVPSVPANVVDRGQ